MSISKLPPSARPSTEPSAHSHGLIEEESAGDDLVVVCIFLNKTKGERAIPAARRLLFYGLLGLLPAFRVMCHDD
ncbi:hypothetical protein O988_08832 [Pseudogymnoascus sp. VKM F-3808]|nr:hypothetical protein O988_08832 [Pseudogymnoascus sp. VKM F-3808]